MLGNVFQWCADEIPGDAPKRILRGGSYNEEGCTRGAARDDGFSARRFGLSGTTPLNEAVSRWADCLRAMGIQWRCRVPLGVGRKVSRGSGSVPLT